MGIVLCLIVFVVGLLIYFVFEKPKVIEVGRLMFFAGLLAFLLRVFAH
jgi:Na+/phosphate symporter